MAQIIVMEARAIEDLEFADLVASHMCDKHLLETWKGLMNLSLEGGCDTFSYANVDYMTWFQVVTTEAQKRGLIRSN